MVIRISREKHLHDRNRKQMFDIEAKHESDAEAVLPLLTKISVGTAGAALAGVALTPPPSIAGSSPGGSYPMKLYRKEVQGTSSQQRAVERLLLDFIVV